MIDTAEAIVGRFGYDLIGMQVFTPSMGDYPGGLATVAKISPMTELPILVDHPTFGECGIWEDEIISVLCQ